MDFRDIDSHMEINKTKREFISAYSVAKATESLKEGLDRLEVSLKCDDMEGQIEALSDIIVRCLGGLETLGCDTERILRKIVLDSKAGLRLVEDCKGGKPPLK